mgnify:FL=1
MDTIENYQNYVALGFLLNLFATIGFGVYKASNINESEGVHLSTKYEAKANFSKTLFLWFVPFLGFLYVLKEVVFLQFGYLNRGLTVFNYIEDNIKRRHNR